jgi:hypothetical protein
MRDALPRRSEVKRPVFAPIAIAATLSILGCGDPSDDLSITVTSPPAGGASADLSYIVEWTVESQDWPDVYINLYADTDTDPSSGLVLLEDSIAVETTGWLWDCSTFPEDDYYVMAVVHQGGDERGDYSDGMLTIAHGPLGNVQGLEIVADSSSGTSVFLAWDLLPGATGYRVYFSPDAAGSWVQVGETADLWFEHDAPSAGEYGILGYRLGEESSGFDNVATTMPVIFDTTYTVWDDAAPEGWFSAIRITNCGAYYQEYPDSIYNLYCHQAGGGPLPGRLFSGSAAPAGTGWAMPLVHATSSSIAPETGYADSVHVEQGDVVFAHFLNLGAYVKIMVQEVPTNPDEPGSRGVSFRYEYQDMYGMRLFTTTSL